LSAAKLTIEAVAALARLQSKTALRLGLTVGKQKKKPPNPTAPATRGGKHEG